jgi:hypothetical protein
VGSAFKKREDALMNLVLVENNARATKWQLTDDEHAKGTEVDFLVSRNSFFYLRRHGGVEVR